MDSSDRDAHQGDDTFRPPAGDRPGHRRRARLGKTKIRIMELKCKCGTMLKFRSSRYLGDGKLYPTGDSFTCSSCGKVYDLKEMRNLEKGAQTS